MNNSIARAAMTGLATFALGVAAAGCQNNKDKTEAAPNAPKPVVSAPAGTPVPTDATRLKTGPAPLTYMLGTGGNVRIVDIDTGKVVVRAVAPEQAVITLDETKGVSIANKVIKPGPLPAGHRYELWLDRK